MKKKKNVEGYRWKGGRGGGGVEERRYMLMDIHARTV